MPAFFAEARSLLAPVARILAKDAYIERTLPGIPTSHLYRART
jgi:hypothetical protein